jgi:ABC-type dipeptide/oligopeptide/nickel transport system permease component
LVPSARTGAASRSAYAFVRAAQAAGLFQGLWAHVLRWSVLAVPVLAGFSAAAAVLGAARASVVFCGLAGLVTLAFSTWLFVKSQNDVPLGLWTGAVLGTGAVATTFRYVRQGSALHAR